MKYKVGDTVRVVRCSSGGNFAVGDIVKIIQIGDDDGYEPNCYGAISPHDGLKWYLNEDEVRSTAESEIILQAKKAADAWRNTDTYHQAAQIIDALIADDLAALRHQIWERQLWHDATADPPKVSGLYYGKKDDTNSMYACRYRDGVWTLDMYPQQKMDIVQWADYTAFVREPDAALRGPTREQMSEFKTCDLVDELRKREGVETHIAEPYQDVTISINGPAIVLVVTD